MWIHCITLNDRVSRLNEKYFRYNSANLVMTSSLLLFTVPQIVVSRNAMNLNSNGQDMAEKNIEIYIFIVNKDSK